MNFYIWLRDVLFPPRCNFCRKMMLHGNICPECEKDLPYHAGLIKTGEFFSACASSLYYKDIVRKSILRFKFGGKRFYAEAYARLLKDTIVTELSDRYDVITWAPVSKKRMWERGYDQAQLLAENTAKLLGTKAVRLLEKRRHTEANSKLKGREKRNANVSGAYAVTAKANVAGVRVLLIDDVYTTGATLSECARTLLMAGAEDVVCATVAVTPGKR